MSAPYYEDEWVTLYHGDCREVLPELETVDLILTDPPYGVTYVSNSAAGKGTRPITNDGTRLSLALYRSVFPLLKAQHVLWFTRWDAWPDVWAEMGQWFPLRGMLVWDKGSPGMGDLAHWGPSYELIASAGMGKISGSRDGSILRYTGVSSRNRLHPTEKPPALLAYLIAKLSAQTILDPFAGSGATLVAAKGLGRKAIGVEFDERYCEVIAKRLDQDTLFDGAA
jgi:site-specific DNA-methyltransferase (adenine-specific)